MYKYKVGIMTLTGQPIEFTAENKSEIKEQIRRKEMNVTKKIVYNVEDFELNFEPIEDSIKIEKTKEGYSIDI